MWLHWKGRGAAARHNEYQLLGSLWQEEGEVDADEPNVEEPLQQREAAEVSQGHLPAQDSFTIANLHFLQHISDAPCDRISLRALVLTGAVNRRRGLGRASEEAVSADYDPGSSTAHPAAGIRDQHCGLLQL